MSPSNGKGLGSTAEWRLGQLVAGRFQVRRLVASGGMANVYEAEDVQSGRVGALKLLRQHCSTAPDAIERLAREADAAQRLSGPHAVQALAAGRLVSGEPWLFMELLEGVSLRDLLQRRGRLRVHEALHLAEQAATGLCTAHAVGVLHRDIKPANLFLVGREPDLLVKLLDFGVSKLSGKRALTREGVALGTFSYMPPEQMMSAKRVDGRADLFSLGVVLYESIGGRLPFAASSVRELMQRMEANDWVPLSQLRPDAPAELDSLLARTLHADPDERFASAHALRDALSALRDRALPQRTLSVGALPGATPSPARVAEPVTAVTAVTAAVPAPAPAPAAAGQWTKSIAVADAGRARTFLVETIIPETRPRR
jgi:serine/threonine protein kinase